MLCTGILVLAVAAAIMLLQCISNELTYSSKENRRNMNAVSN